MAAVMLAGGLFIQSDALALALDMETRGLTLTAKDGVLLVSPGSALRADDRVAVQRWKRHLLAIAAYQPPEGAQ